MNRRNATLAVGLAVLFGGGAIAPAGAQTAATLVGVSGYGNFHAAGIVATIAGDTNQNASLALEWRRVSAASFRAAQPLIRISTTTFTGSLFSLAPVGSLLAYATAPGNVAFDGTRKNGLYTENLVEELSRPGVVPVCPAAHSAWPERSR